MTIVPIKTARDYNSALRRIEQLMDAKPGSKAGDELDVLTTLVEAYEARHHAICPPDPIEAIKFRVDQRSLSLEMIRRLHRRLRIPLESLIGTAA